MVTENVRQPALALVLVIALVTFAAACGGDDDDDGDATPEPTAEATETPEPDDDATASPTEAPAETVAGMALDEFVIRADRTRARPGTVTFEVRNEGELEHQFLVIRTDVEKDELPRLPDDEGVDESDLDVVGRIESLAPGEDDEVTVEVEEGNYVLVCNLFAGGESHYLEGMYTDFEVTLTASVGTPVPTSVPSPSPEVRR